MACHLPIRLHCSPPQPATWLRGWSLWAVALAATAMSTACELDTAGHFQPRGSPGALAALQYGQRASDLPTASSVPSVPSVPLASQVDFGPRAAEPVQDLTY